MNDTPKSVYLAGPDVFLPDAMFILGAKVAMAAAYGFKALIPGDDHVAGRTATTASISWQAIYAANVETMKQADFGIMNLTPFRGISADVGTVFELGLMTGMDKPVFGYTNVQADYIDRIWLKASSGEGADAKWVDDHGCGIENYANPDNLMLAGALEAGGGAVRVSGAPTTMFDDLDGFRACLELAAKHFAASSSPAPAA